MKKLFFSMTVFLMFFIAACTDGSLVGEAIKSKAAQCNKNSDCKQDLSDCLKEKCNKLSKTNPSYKTCSTKCLNVAFASLQSASENKEQMMPEKQMPQQNSQESCAKGCATLYSNDQGEYVKCTQVCSSMSSSNMEPNKISQEKMSNSCLEMCKMKAQKEEMPYETCAKVCMPPSEQIPVINPKELGLPEKQEVKDSMMTEQTQPDNKKSMIAEGTIQTTASEPCFDPDKTGKLGFPNKESFFTKTKIEGGVPASGNTKQREDFCSTPKRVVEFNCKDEKTYSWNGFLCPDNTNCVEGACQKAAQETLASSSQMMTQTTMPSLQASVNTCMQSETTLRKVGSKAEDSICAKRGLEKASDIDPLIQSATCLGVYKGVPLMATASDNKIAFASFKGSSMSFNVFWNKWDTCNKHMETAEAKDDWENYMSMFKVPKSVEEAMKCMDLVENDLSPFYDEKCMAS